jgi:hypothetical protein
MYTDSVCVHRQCLCIQTVFVYTDSVYVHRHSLCIQRVFVYTDSVYVYRQCLCIQTVSSEMLICLSCPPEFTVIYIFIYIYNSVLAKDQIISVRYSDSC